MKIEITFWTSIIEYFPGGGESDSANLRLKLQLPYLPTMGMDIYPPGSLPEFTIVSEPTYDADTGETRIMVGCDSRYSDQGDVRPLGTIQIMLENGWEVDE